ncbi:MAG: hypothetical protein E7184_03240 [Erysipelotrichaceae bacterium]|nr:hypothetical protein [Erysipelotrichaceae bacterium]
MAIKTLNNIDVINPIKNYKQYFIEIFVSFYGEKNRSRIEERFNSITFLHLPKENNDLEELITAYCYYDALCLVDDFNEKVLGQKITIRYLTPGVICEIYDNLKSQSEMNEEQELAFFEIVSVLSGQIDEELDVSTEEGQKTIKICQEWLNDETNVKYLLKKLKMGSNIWRENYQDRYNTLILKANEEYENLSKQITDNVFYNTALSKLKSLKIKSLDEAIEALLFQYVYEQGNWQGACIPYLDKEQIKSICILPLIFNLSKNTFIHECNHAIASNLINSNDEETNIKVGLTINTYSNDISKDDVIVVKENDDRYDLFDEIVNDYLTSKILKLVDDLPIFFEASWSGNTYNVVSRLLNDFLEKHIEAIKEHYMQDDVNYFSSYYGEDYEYLIDLINNFNNEESVEKCKVISEKIYKLDEQRDLKIRRKV